MRKFVTAFAAASLAFGVVACGETADAPTEAAGISGTWKINLDSGQWENDNSNYVFADGQYTCNSCLPPYSVAADGEWQSIDRPGVDEVKYTIVDDTTITSASRFEGKDLGNATWTLGDDGQTMTVAWNNLDGEEEVSGQTVFTRVAAGPDGSHAASGEWAPSAVSEVSDAGLTVSITVEGDTFTLSGNGDGYTATIGGDAVPIEGSNSGTMVAVEKIGDNSYRETFTRDGETVGISELTVDGDTLSFSSSDPRDGSKANWTATRQ